MGSLYSPPLPPLYLIQPAFVPHSTVAQSGDAISGKEDSDV